MLCTAPVRQKHKIYKKKLKVAAIDLTDEASELFEEKLSHFVEIDDTVKEEKFVANDEPLGDSTPPPADPTLQGSTLTVLASEEQPDGCGIVLFMGERQPVPSTKVTSEDGESAEVGGATEQPAEKQGGATEQPAEKQPAPKPAPKPSKVRWRSLRPAGCAPCRAAPHSPPPPDAVPPPAPHADAVALPLHAEEGRSSQDKAGRRRERPTARPDRA